MSRLTVHELRQALESRISQLIGLLDELDGDTDLEPSLGALETVDQARWTWGFHADLELQCEGEGDHDEREPDEFHICFEYGIDQRDGAARVWPGF